MNFYDVLAAEKMGGGLPTINFFDLLFAQSTGGKNWQVYEGTLPATINANGDDMRQYQVWGNVGGVGDKTANYFDYSNYVYGYYISSSGAETEAVRDPTYESTWLNHSDYISVLPDESYTISAHHQNMNASQVVAIAWYDENKTFILRSSTTISIKNAGSYSFTAAAPQNAEFAIFNFFTDDVQGVMFVPGATPPETFAPFGYEVDMSTSDGTNTTITPIYIGDTALQKDEYIDYQAGKVFKLVSYPFSPTIEVGSINVSNGENIDSSATRLRTNFTKGMQSTGIYTINADGNAAQCAILVYDETRTYMINESVRAWIDMPLKFELSAPRYVRFTFRKDNSTALLPSDISKILLKRLQPTDPPVPLPALPTREGTTIVDYAGSGAAPEKVYFEYQGGKQP